MFRRKRFRKRKNIPLQGKSLADYPAGTDIEITGMPGGPGFRQRLGELGLYEGAKAKIIKNDRFGPVILKVFNSKIALGQHQAKRTYVKKV
ncbi:MAG: ferrous iron transport protein A [Patescibacteria group bacterium]|nr:ferrous iron transport protein A [Patescibacteria group bacterium]